MVLVTGGTGLVGSHLLLKLAMQNVPVRAIYRSVEKLEQVKKTFSYYTTNVTALYNKIDWVQGDILDIPSLDDAFQNVTHVYHCAALISFSPSDFNILDRVNREGTANIVNMCIAKNVQKLCYVSTIGTIGRTSTSLAADEETEFNRQFANPYAITKHLAEMEVWRGAQEQIQVVIINPGVILGPGYWENGSGSFFKTAHKNYSYYPPGGSGFVAVVDVTAIMVRLMNTDIHGERYIVVTSNNTYKEVLEMISRAMNKKAPYKKLQPWQLQIGKYLDRLRHLLTGKPRTITHSTIHGLLHPTTFDSSKIIKTLDYTFEPLENSITFSSRIFMKEHAE
ncbi:NAD-dependent epimerase/dehydratase family protein [Maribacter confluentis]|uniref:NAD-dependent epimerase/dehydratase family protein n=1 Tax=Maribacter confluentis TaxID=1656093 RepID=A0ABT8RNU0_9FLAO|nr:NAD-dependent epimerase/dehydratase family protein [Maribacter confluentis]MDO1512526.1 NAD-dependent epimerase/dehydratase family protein [Maribacter confluentis]